MGISMKAAFAVAFSSLLAAGCGAVAPQGPTGMHTKQILPNATQVTLNDAGLRGVLTAGIPGGIVGGITPADALLGYAPLGLSANIGATNIVMNQYLQAQTGGFSPHVLPTSLQGTWVGRLGWPLAYPGILGGFGLGPLGLRSGGADALGVSPLGVISGFGLNPLATVPVGHMANPTAFWPNRQGIPYTTTSGVEAATIRALTTPVATVQQPVMELPAQKTD